MANDAVTFREKFERMEDVYAGFYRTLLAEYRVNPQVTAGELLRRSSTRLPMDQMPAVFIYQDPLSMLRIVHHIHQVETPFGQPANPLSDIYLGFNGEVFNGSAQVIQIPATFFATTGNIIVPSNASLTALLATAQNGMTGPFNEGDPDTEMINTRKAIPVPHAYVGLIGFRNLTPLDAWQQVGQQIILDGREEDCAVLLKFLRAATVVVRGAERGNGINLPPTTIQPNALLPPVDGPVLEHVHRKLRQCLPRLFAPPAPEGVPQAVQVAGLLTQAVTDGIDAWRADRDIATAPKNFSEVFPANAISVRRLCLAGNNDDNLPQFWRYFAERKRKKGQGLGHLTNLTLERCRDPTSSKIRPIITTALWANISSFELGAIDLEIITQGVSPFLMCPASHTKAEQATELHNQYMMLHGDHSTPMLSDVRQLIPSNAYNIPEDLYSLVDFIGAYSVIWDVLVGSDHPLSMALHSHHTYWVNEVRATLRAAPLTMYAISLLLERCVTSS